VGAIYNLFLMVSPTNLINNISFHYNPHILRNLSMARKTKKTNPRLLALIQDLKKNSSEKDVPIWKDVALRLEKPLSNWPEVNLDRIDKYTQEGETALVPGKVLSSGNLNKKITIAAWSFSERSQEKIKKAGGKHILIEELMKSNPKGENIRILG